MLVIRPVGLDGVEVRLADAREDGDLPENSFNPRARYFDVNVTAPTVIRGRDECEVYLLWLEAIFR